MTWYKVTIDGTDYEEEFLNVQVTGRECDVASAILVADNKQGGFWTDTVDVFDDITIQMRAVTHATPQGGSLQTVFGGTVREVKPYASMGGFYTAIKCKGLGAALEDTHCKDMFGRKSNQPTLYAVEDILEDLVDSSINKSYSSANNTGYSISKDYIPTIDAALEIPFFNAPYQTCKEVVNLVCTLDTAYRAGSTAGPQWFVNSDGDLRVKTIGSQQADGGHGGGAWGTYYNGQAANTDAKLYEDEDFYEYTLTKPTDQYANSVVLAFDLRKPAHDYITEYNADAGDPDGGALLWGNDGLDDVTDVTGDTAVGDYAVKFDPDGNNVGYGYYPSTADAGWDVTKWGSAKSVPTVNFYILYHDAGNVYVYLSDNTVARKTDYFRIYVNSYIDLSVDDQWQYVSLPIGPYYKIWLENTYFEWTDTDGDWTNVDSVEFRIDGAAVGAYIYIDDLHFTGKCVREAVDTSKVTSYHEHQHAILSRTPLDDSAVASDDSGMAGQLCYAELLRRVTPPRTFTCTIPFKPLLKPGEYFTLYAGKTSAGTYKLNGVDFRTLQYTHFCTQQARPQTSLILTDDVKNSFPLSPLNQRAILNEYMLVNNEKATDMQGGDVDLLIPHLRKTY